MVLFLAIIIAVLGACSQQGEVDKTEPISSFEGYFLSVNTSNELQFDCSEVAKRNINSTTDEGYNCNVDVNENTTLKTEDGKGLSVEELKKWEISKLNQPQKAKVILSEDKDISTNKKSREELKASEIIILN